MTNSLSIVRYLRAGSGLPRNQNGECVLIIDANLPTLEEHGTVILGTFEAMDVVQGNFDFEEMARKTHNLTFKRFADDRGLVLFELDRAVR